MLKRLKNWIKDKWLRFKKWLLALFLLPVAFAANEIILDQTKNEVSLEKVNSKYQQSVGIKAKYTLEASALVKTDIKNAELDKYKKEPKDKIEVVLGDKNSQEFKPDIEMKRWDEVSFKLKPKGIDTVATKDKDLKFEGDRVKFNTPKLSYEMYDVPATANDEGGYKYVWYVNEKPTTNKFEFDIETQGLDFFYQPPLYEENTDPNLTCTETQCVDKDGQVMMERPENVVGSYAVYHQTKGGMNDKDGKDYKVGKAFHIYRPHIIDASGAETWGILHIENGIYSVEIPQEFLDTAVYPIKSNDTFGFTGDGTSNLTSSFRSGTSLWTLRIGDFASLGVAGTLDKISVRLSTTMAGTDAVDVTALLNRYVSAKSYNLVKKIERTNLSLTVAEAWYDFTAASEALTSDTYVLSVIADPADIVTNDAYVFARRDNVSTGTYSQDSNYSTTNYYTTWRDENPWTPANEIAGVYSTSIYATYSVSSPAPTPPMLIID